MCVQVHMCHSASGGRRITWRSQLFPSILWALEMELVLSGLAASALSTEPSFSATLPHGLPPSTINASSFPTVMFQAVSTHMNITWILFCIRFTWHVQFKPISTLCIHIKHHTIAATLHKADYYSLGIILHVFIIFWEKPTYHLNNQNFGICQQLLFIFPPLINNVTNPNLVLFF